MRRTVLLIALLALAGCGSSGSSPGGEGGGGESARKTAIYVSTNPLGTDQFLNLIAQGARAGGKACGVDVKVVQSSDPNSLASNLRAAAAAKPDLLIANSFDSVQTIQELAKQDPAQKWTLVDATVPDAPNVRGILFKENEGMYLIGAAFAQLAEGGAKGFPASKSLGFVGAVDNALVRRWLAGYEQGVRDTDAGERVQVGWAGSYTDPAGSKELAISQHQKGAKYIAGVAAAGNSGVFEAAKDRGFYTSGVDVDERPKDPAHILLSMVKRSDLAVRDAVCAAAKGSFKGGDVTLGVKQGAVGPDFLTLPKDQLRLPSRLPAAVQAKLRALKQKIASGAIAVKDT